MRAIKPQSDEESNVKGEEYEKEKTIVRVEKERATRCALRACANGRCKEHSAHTRPANWLERVHIILARHARSSMRENSRR